MKSITLKGFQSHINSTLDLHSGLNIIVGASNAGKSAVHRAIRWCVHNEPLGDGFVNQQTGNAEVSITTDDSHTVTRNRGKENSYVVDGKPFTGFGTKVPQEVHDVLGMQKAQFGDQLIWLNFSSQHDAPFLLSETGGQAARTLGKLAGTEDIDAAGKLSNSDLIKARNTKTTQLEILKSLTDKLQEYAHLDEAERAWAKTDHAVNVLSAFQKRYDILKAIAVRVQTTKERITQIKGIIGLVVIRDLTPIKEALSLYLDYKFCYNQYEKLKSAVQTQNFFVNDLRRNMHGAINEIESCKRASTMYETHAYIVDKLFILDDSVKMLKLVLNQKETIEKSSKLCACISETIGKHFDLHMIQGKCNNLQSRINSWSKAKKDIQSIGYTEDVVKSLQPKCLHLHQLRSMQLAIENSNYLLGRRQQEAQASKTSMSQTKKEYMDYLVSLGVCPLCSNPMDAHDAQHYVAGL